MKFNVAPLHRLQGFAIHSVKFLVNPLLLVYRHVCYGEVSKQRKQIHKGMSRGCYLMAQGTEGIRQTFYGGQTGVGVYQGEPVIILKWVLDSPHQWVICKLRPSLVHLLRRDIVCELLQVAWILLRYLQSASVKNRLQNSGEIPLWHNCPHTRQHQNIDIALSEECENPECPLQNLLGKQSLPLESPKCPYEEIIDLLNQGLNQSGKEPFIAINALLFYHS
jgi:hypothetical protein